jgi:flagellar M-ring protein FliF
MEVTRQVEKHLESKAQSMLDEVLGSGTSVVRVTALLDFQQLERTSEMYDPNAPSIRSEERVKTSRSSSDKAPESNESQEEDTEETVRTNYELNKTVEHVIDAVGNIDRISVAVLVDGTYEEVTGEDGAVQNVYQPRSPEELDRLESIVRNAVGFDGDRSDQIEMVNIPFDRRDLEEDRQMLDSMYQREFLFEIGKKVGTVLLILLAFLYLRKKARKLFKAMGKLIPPAPKPRPATESPSVTALQQEAEPEEPLEPERRRPKLVDRMQETAKEQPEEIARVIKTIMME